jgi:polysaccharide export outer membrane protein
MRVFMIRFFPAILLLAACSGAGPETRQDPLMQAFVPTEAASPAAPAAKGARPEPALMSGDLLRITVFRQPDLDLEVRVPENGSISFPLIGAVQAAGRSSSALEQNIRQQLDKEYLKNPSVTVTVREYAKRKVFILGGVAKPDGYEVAPDSRMTVLQLVAAAGGFTDRAYKEYVQVVRRQEGRERAVIRISLVEVERQIAGGKPEADMELWPDDLVVVPSALRVAHVLGAVHRPGSVDVPNNARMTVSMAVAQAGSYTKFAATGRVQILRHDPSGKVSRIAVDLDAILDDGRVELDLNLEPGDVIWVPERGIF